MKRIYDNHVCEVSATEKFDDAMRRYGEELLAGRIESSSYWHEVAGRCVVEIGERYQPTEAK